MSMMVIPITGFTQGPEEQTGMEKWWWNYARPRYSTPYCIVYPPSTWKMSVERRLEQIQRLRIKHLFIVAYSHGQQAAMRLAALAKRYGVETVDMALCDPVGRNPILPQWTIAQIFTARSLTPWHRIDIPETVSSVAWVRQYVNRPQAHDLRWNPATTYVSPAVVINCTHSDIQWHGTWFKTATDALDAWHRKYHPAITP